MDLTKEQLLVMLKKAYVRGVWDTIEQRTNTTREIPEAIRNLKIPDSVIADLIEEK